MASFQRVEHDGNVCVPQKYKSNQQLATWVMNLRALKVDKDKKKGTSSHGLTDRREALLNSIGFVWSAHDAMWEEQFNKLVKFKATNGHTNVRHRAGKLGHWVSYQKSQYGKKRVMPQKNSEKVNQRINKLDSLEFNW